MAIEQGIIIRMGAPRRGPATAWVRTVRTSACASCASRDHCHEADSKQEQEVEAINTAGARVGDRIQLSIRTSTMLKAIFLLYLFPILCMLAGGIAGDAMASRWDANPSVLSVAGAFICLGAALIIVRIRGQRMGGSDEYRPKIIRIISHEPERLAADNTALSCTRSEIEAGIGSQNGR